MTCPLKKGRAMLRLAVVLLPVVCGLAAIAVAGSDKSIDNVKALAGDWSSLDRSPAAIHLNEDGTYDGTAATGAKTTGKVSVVDGKASFQSTTSAGTVTLSEENGKEVLTFTRSDGRGSARLQRVK
jgi:hypothetical protein